MTTTQNPEATCITCQIEAKRQAGEEITRNERNHWSMWGCTCDPQVAAEARDFIDRVTR